MSGCDHIVGLSAPDPETCLLEHASGFGDWQEQDFNFCPECGESLQTDPRAVENAPGTDRTTTSGEQDPSGNQEGVGQ